MSTYDDCGIEQTHSAALLARLLDSAPKGSTLEVVEESALRCKIKAMRPDRFPKPVTVEYSIYEALEAGSFDEVDERERWKRSAKDLLYWGAIRRIARQVFADIAWGGESLGDQLAASTKSAETTEAKTISDELDQIEGG